MLSKEYHLEKYNQYTQNAWDAFRQRDTFSHARALSIKGFSARSLYEKEKSEIWDMKTYGAFNAAGGAWENIGWINAARNCYQLALESCERVARGRSPEWNKNINFLKDKVNQLTTKTS